MLQNLILQEGSRIAIIGGGPAGSFFAHFIHKFADEKGMRLSVTIFDGKDFLLRGPKGCNLCAGIIAESLTEKLEEEGISLPEKRIISRAGGYCLHVSNETLFLSCTEHTKNTIPTVFRGNGPRFSTFPEVISFDDFLLSWAQDEGAEVINQPIWDIELPDNKSSPVCLSYGKKNNLIRFEADLVVGAFGVNSFLMKKIKNLGFGYKPPSTLVTYQAELKLGQEKINQCFGNNIHVYMPKSHTIRYATVIPKGDYITITLIGKKDVNRDIFLEFLSLEEIQNIITPTVPHCFCIPRIAVSPSKNPFTNRFVMIGDASFSRHYKNGIESAFLTAKLAARAAISWGVDDLAFLEHYYEPAKRQIIHDNFYGQILFLLNDIISSVPLLSQSHLSLAKRNRPRDPAKKLRSILWNMFTGNIPYKDIFKITLDLKLQRSLLWNTIRLSIIKIKNHIKKFERRVTHGNTTRPPEK